MVSPRAGRLLQRAAGGDLGVEDALAVFGAQTFAQRGAVVGVGSGHRDEHAEDPRVGANPAPHRLDRADQVTSPSSASGCGGTGMTMPSAATSALTPTSDRLGGQSSTTSS